MSFSIDDAQYDAGRLAFVAGKTLRQVADRIIASSDDEGLQAASFTLGFLDALLDQLRLSGRPMVICNPGSPT